MSLIFPFYSLGISEPVNHKFQTFQLSVVRFYAVIIRFYAVNSPFLCCQRIPSAFQSSKNRIPTFLAVNQIRKIQENQRGSWGENSRKLECEDKVDWGVPIYELKV